MEVLEGNQRSDGGSLGILAILAAVLVLVAAGSGAYFLTHRSAAASAHHRSGPDSRADARETASQGNHRSVSPLEVTSVSPASSTTGVAWTAPVLVSYNQPLAQGTALPTLSPAVPGSWQRSGTKSVEFRPAGGYAPYAKETLTVPAGTTARSGARLQSDYHVSFTVKGGSVLRLQELLAELGYLPLGFTPSPGSAVKTSAPSHLSSEPPAPSGTATPVSTAPPAPATTDHEPSATGKVTPGPLGGTFFWRFKNIPAALASLWHAGQANVIMTGAVMEFENVNGLGVDGVAGPKVWQALLSAAANHQIHHGPYDWVYVSEGSPEYVTVWRNGKNVFRTLANTGIAQAPTQQGTWPVFARYRTTTMSGTEPNGQHYSDPGIPWTSYFHGGDALHGFIRATYGWPQSLGCVEMPFSSAHVVWPYTPLGTLVTVG